VLAVWTYGLPRIDPTVDGILHRYVDEILAPYMAPELRYVMSGYRTLPFPTEGAETRGFRSETQGSLDDLVGFLSSFSGAVLFEKAEGRLPVDGIYSDLTVAWGAPDRVLRWRWDFSVRLARLGAKRLTLRTSL
jgi:hypothetical protein